MVNAILGIICIGAIAAFLVMWAKWEDEKEKRWDEISEATTWHNRYVRTFEELEDETKMRLEYSASFMESNYENKIMQDKLSAILCPTNNHVWRDGVCVKCGRVKDNG